MNIDLIYAVENKLNRATPYPPVSPPNLEDIIKDYGKSYESNWLGYPQSHGHSDKTQLTRISQIGKPVLTQAIRIPHINEMLVNLNLIPSEYHNGADGPKDAVMHRRFHLGHVLEGEVVGLLQAHGFTVTDTQTEVVMDRERGVVGHCDGILHYEGKRYVFDVKTMSDYAFREFTKKSGPHDNSGYVTQLACYHHLLGTDGAFILAYNKNSHLFRVLPLSNERMKSRYNRALNVIELLANLNTVEDVDALPRPPMVAEISKSKPTGLYVPHPSVMWDLPVVELCYKVYFQKRWGKDKLYVKYERNSILEKNDQ